jgi:integrase
MPDADVARALAGAPPRVRSILALAALAALAGLRASEIALLDRADVLDSAVPPVLLVMDGKGGHQRVVPLAVELVEVLRADGLPASGPLFAKRDGRPIHRARVSGLASEYLRELGVTGTLHSLRHWFATELYRQSNDLRLVQEMLGHASPSTTAGYAAWSPGKAATVIATLEIPKDAPAI